MLRVSAMKKNQQGFTLVELIVVMAIFIIVIMITADAFNTLLVQTTKIFRSEESNIEGVVGLEMMRHDLQQGGYGLFTEVSPVAYTAEAASAPANAYNETATTNPPRAFVAGDNLVAINETSDGAKGILAGTDYLSIKGTSVARSRASQRWTYLQNAAGTGVVPNSWPSDAENFGPGEHVVLMQRRVTQTDNSLTLVPGPDPVVASDHYFTYSPTAFEAYSSNTDSYIMYGLNPAGNTNIPRMPFNRSDYFVARPATATQVPQMCAPNAGILYKTTVNHDDGKLTYLPILDCVADMQVVFGWDLMDGASTGTDGLVDTYSNADGSSISGPPGVNVPAALLDAAAIRNSLKIVKIFILAQNGRRDPGYTSPSPIHVGDQTILSNTRGSNVDIAANGWQNYRWKLYQIIVRPKNLTSNQ